MHDPKKRLAPPDPVRSLSREDLERRMVQAASCLAAGRTPDETPGEAPAPSWIEPRQLIRILAPFVSMN